MGCAVPASGCAVEGRPRTAFGESLVKAETVPVAPEGRWRQADKERASQPHALTALTPSASAQARET
jgi:hypothetical protein